MSGVADLPVLGQPLAIELANTVVAGEDGERDLLRSADDVTAWIDAHRDELPPRAGDAPPTPAQLRRLRDAVRELIDAAIEQRAPAPDALRRVNAAGSAVAPRPILRWQDDGPPRVTDASAEARPAKAALALIARSAVEVLGGADRTRLRRCERPGCILVFVATNPRRRWCSPAVCGNRVRVARHYARHHGSAAT